MKRVLVLSALRTVLAGETNRRVDAARAIVKYVTSATATCAVLTPGVRCTAKDAGVNTPVQRAAIPKAVIVPISIPAIPLLVVVTERASAKRMWARAIVASALAKVRALTHRGWLIAISLVVGIGSCVSSADNSSQGDGAQADQMEISYTPSIQAIDGVSDPGTNVQGISLADSNANYVPQLSEEGATQVGDAISAITANNKTVGFAFIDLQTGSGYVYNLDQRVYGASSFKGPVLIYGCQQALETGKTSISRVNSSAQDAIINSDNTSYYRMRNAFERSASKSLSAWLSSMNISTTLANDTSFPHYSARESLKLWMNAFLYLSSPDSNKEITEWAKKMFSGTAVSMIRSGVDPTSNSVSREKAESVAQELLGTLCTGKKTVEVGEAKKTKTSSADESATVYDKAGWINGSSDDAICDAGIIEEDGKYYLITIMTNLADGETSRAEVSGLAAALWDQRSTLAPEQGYKQV